MEKGQLMSKTTKRQITTIQYSESDEEGNDTTFYLEDAWRDSYDDYAFSQTEQVEMAHDLSESSLEDQVRIYEEFQEAYPECDCQLVKLTIEVTSEELSLGEDGYREARQRIALEKLNKGDIEALGLMKIFTYIKTKYHNA